MSGGVNIKAISQSRSDAGGGSSLPLPRSMMPLSKVGPKAQQYGGTPSPTGQNQHVAGRQPSSSPSTVELLRGAALKNHLLQQKGGAHSPRSPAATERTDGTRSAYSSPQIPKREARRSKDMLDLRASTLNQTALRDLHLRTANKNWTFGKYRLKSVDNAAEGDALCADVQQGLGRGRVSHAKGANGNEPPGVSTSGMADVQKEVGNISNQHLGASERGVVSGKSKSSHDTFNMKRRGSEPGQVNAVAPFRFRFQVHEDTDPAPDDLSDCSSDSMEVCCEELDIFYSGLIMFKPNK
ncbi:hypothetical protein EYF80_013276 [Liparis tanakae]|uniref:Uncharacterized protein n=1 Tax=Liparis tanakae TaxID=230148 RepID=A0A4Z2IF53_9TELE|nr:hypothetical protein EYF80_013276 [Liparis tanakae]